MEIMPSDQYPPEAAVQPQLAEDPEYAFDGYPGDREPPSIHASLTALAEFTGVGLGGLDDDLLDIIALRLVAECGDEPSLTDFGPIVDEVRRAGTST
jgi:hypothetical protein